MLISDIELSLLILRQAKNSKKLKGDAQIKPKEVETKRDGVIIPEY